MTLSVSDLSNLLLHQGNLPHVAKDRTVQGVFQHAEDAVDVCELLGLQVVLAGNLAPRLLDIGSLGPADDGEALPVLGLRTEATPQSAYALWPRRFM